MMSETNVEAIVKQRLICDRGVANSEQRYVVHLVAMAMRQLELGVSIRRFVTLIYRSLGRRRVRGCVAIKIADSMSRFFFLHVNELTKSFV